MHYGVSLPNFGVGVSASRLGQLAHMAEVAGWDGFFLWDHTLAPGPISLVDPLDRPDGSCPPVHPHAPRHAG